MCKQPGTCAPEICGGAIFYVVFGGDIVCFRQQLTSSDVIAFYFSAHWCPPCQWWPR